MAQVKLFSFSVARWEMYYYRTRHIKLSYCEGKYSTPVITKITSLLMCYSHSSVE